MKFGVSPSHRNSLGYVIAEQRSHAMIVWGNRLDGRRVHIDDAQRGGAEGLICECKSPLVAKKGDEIAHHFAHKAGTERVCEIAIKSALTNFLSDTLLVAGKVELPLTGKLKGFAKVLAVSILDIGSIPAVLIDAQKDRRVLLVPMVKRTNLDGPKAWGTEQRVSTMVIDLRNVRNRPDEDIQIGVISQAPREWIFRNNDRDDITPKEIMRRLFGL